MNHGESKEVSKSEEELPPFPDVIGYQIKDPIPGVGFLFFQLLVSVTPKTPQTIQVIGITFGYCSEMNGKT